MGGKAWFVRFIIVFISLLFASWAQAEKRVALVVGNAGYRNAPALTTPANDAEDMAKALKDIGFTVMLERNLSKRDMEIAIGRFARLVQDADVALFYYAGHGLQYRGVNYLAPIDSTLEDEFSLSFGLTRLDDVLYALDHARGVRILILDACRDNPLLDRLSRTAMNRSYAPTRGLVRIEPTRGMLIAYSTQPNQVAIDGDGRNSPFASALIKELNEPGVEVGALFRRVAADVHRQTEGRQLPELSLSLLGELYLNTQETDLQAWARLRSSENPADIEAFMARYPTSVLVPDARQRLAGLDRERARPTPAEPDYLAKGPVKAGPPEQQPRGEPEPVTGGEAPPPAQLSTSGAPNTGINKETGNENETGNNPKSDQAESERLERERSSRAQAEREQGVANAKTTLLTPPVESPSVLPSPAIDACRAEAKQLNRILKRGKAARADLAAFTERAKCTEHRTRARTRLAAIDRSLTETPRGDKPKVAGRFDGAWAVTWVGVTNCARPGGTFLLMIRDDLITGRRSGRVASSGAVRWSQISVTGVPVSYTGMLRGNSGSGSFRNRNNCRGTFVARRS